MGFNYARLSGIRQFLSPENPVLSLWGLAMSHVMISD